MKRPSTSFAIVILKGGLFVLQSLTFDHISAVVIDNAHATLEWKTGAVLPITVAPAGATIVEGGLQIA